ncbi:MAG: sulfatase-like hydrolase/transferase [Planctomycetaceae bacterium]|nr:sulfatase-like hydrolase/transferase [Planctomycetaceae bacterium]
MSFLLCLSTLSAQETATDQVNSGVSVRPNILFLLSDDHSYPFLGCYGDQNVRTPVLDRLAAEGMRFHRFFTAAPQCVPSRAALMTGRSPVAARITRFSSPLHPEETIFPELLREQAGYFTGVCGRSYHLDGAGDKPGPGLAKFIEDNGLKTFRNRMDSVTTGADQAAPNQVSEFLDLCPADRPFFLWVNFSDPHHPWTAQAQNPAPESLTLPEQWPDLPGMRQQLADYCGEVNRVDMTVGKVLDILNERGLSDNTIVIFAGDNGAALPHGKGSLYDPGCHVPFLVRWPGVVSPGSESRALISGEDLAPTLLEAAGLSVPSRISGRSFLPLLQGQDSPVRSYVFTERGPHGSAPVSATMSNSGYDLARAVRSDRYKLIYNCTPWLPYSPVDSSGGAAWKEIVAAHSSGELNEQLTATYFTSPRPVYELYDLDADPAELRNLSGQEDLAEVEFELRQALAQKMILDFDYLPLPGFGTPTNARGPRNNREQPSRAVQFEQKDKDRDGSLSWEEFSANRNPEEARTWFQARDTNKDNVLSREEFISSKGVRP